MKRITLTRRMAASLDTVFEALVTAEGMAGWWGPDQGPVLIAESDPRVGGRYRVRFRMEDGSEHEASGEFLVLDRPNRVVLSFRWIGDADDSGPSQIEISLRSLGDETELTFVQSGLRDEEVQQSHEDGWSRSLDKLRRNLRRETK
jgi:uncharacterized protein YndB with AHSA1/START domain